MTTGEWCRNCTQRTAVGLLFLEGTRFGPVITLKELLLLISGFKMKKHIRYILMAIAVCLSILSCDVFPNLAINRKREYKIENDKGFIEVTGARWGSHHVLFRCDGEYLINPDSVRVLFPDPKYFSCEVRFAPNGSKIERPLVVSDTTICLDLLSSSIKVRDSVRVDLNGFIIQDGRSLITEPWDLTYLREQDKM